jgi:hypothetical protein
MLAGVILLVSGLLIAIYPPLLSLIVALLLMASGLITLLIAYQNRRLPPEFQNPILRVFFRL